MPRPRKTPVEIAARKVPRVSVLERRLQNPFGEPSTPIELKEPGWTVRTVNADIAADRVWRMTYKGWERVLWTDLANHDQAGGFVRGPDGSCVRGARGQEVLMKIPSADWKAIQQRKAEINEAAMRRPHVQKQQLVEAASRQLGDEAASALNQTMRVIGDVTTTRERIAVEPVLE